MAYKLPASHDVMILWKKVNNITWETSEVILPFYSEGGNENVESSRKHDLQGKTKEGGGEEAEVRSANSLQAHKKASAGRKNLISMSLLVGQEEMNLTCSKKDSCLA